MCATSSHAAQMSTCWLIWYCWSLGPGKWYKNEYKFPVTWLLKFKLTPSELNWACWISLNIFLRCRLWSFYWEGYHLYRLLALMSTCCLPCSQAYSPACSQCLGPPNTLACVASLHRRGGSDLQSARKSRFGYKQACAISRCLVVIVCERVTRFGRTWVSFCTRRSFWSGSANLDRAYYAGDRSRLHDHSKGFPE